MKNKKQVPLIDDYDIAAYMLARGNKSQREATLIDLGHRHDDALAMLVLHDELKRNPKQPHLYAIVLSKFLNRRNADFLLELVGKEHTHLIHVIAIKRMRERIVCLLLRSMDLEIIEKMKIDCSREFLSSVLGDLQLWRLYQYICAEIDCKHPEEPFACYAESRNYLDSHKKMKKLIHHRKDDEIMDHLINCRGPVLFKAIRYLQDREHRGLLKQLELISSTKGPLFGYPVVHEVTWALQGVSSTP